jgi:hypothetical protein
MPASSPPTSSLVRGLNAPSAQPGVLGHGDERLPICPDLAGGQVLAQSVDHPGGTLGGIAQRKTVDGEHG